MNGRVAAAVLDVFRYNPAERRDHDGKWTKTGLDVSNLGSVDLSADPDARPATPGNRDAIPEAAWGATPDSMRPEDKAGFRRPTVKPVKSLLGKVKNQDELDADQRRRSAMKVYSSDAYRDINGPLRDGRPLGEHADVAKDLRSAMQPTPHEVTVSRVADVRAFGVGSWDELAGLAGTEVHDRGFGSTSLNGQDSDDVARLARENRVPPTDAIQVHVKVPKGTRAVWLNGDSHFPEEDELLIQDGTRYRIDRVYRPAHYPYVVVEMSVIGQ